MPKFTLLDATPEKQCDNCTFQEGRHYCLLHSQQVKNMDIVRCHSWKDCEAPSIDAGPGSESHANDA